MDKTKKESIMMRKKELFPDTSEKECEIKDKDNDKSQKTTTNERKSSEWDNFASKTTLHGLCYVQEKDRKLMSRIFWCVLVLAMLSATIYVLLSLLLDYMKYPIKSVWNFRRDEHIETPAITVCLCNSFDTKKIANSSAAFKFFSDPTDFHSTDPDVQTLFETPYSEIFYRYGYSKEDIILDFMIYLENEIINATKFVRRFIFDHKICFATDDMYKNVLSPFLPKISGDVFIEFIISQPKSEIGIAGINDFFGNGIFLYLRQHGTIGDKSKPFLVSPGLATYVLFSTTEYQFLPQPYRSFGEENCLEGVNSDDFINPLRKFPVYTYENCKYELLQNLSALVCGCVTEAFVDLYKDQNISVCTYRRFYTCYSTLKYSFTSVLRTLCKQTCDTSVIEMTHSTMPFNKHHKKDYFTNKNGEDYIHLLLQAKTTNVETVKHEPEMSLSGIMATVGGFLGLFLGASILTLLEWLEFLVTTIKRLFFKLIHRQ